MLLFEITVEETGDISGALRERIRALKYCTSFVLITGDRDIADSNAISLKDFAYSISPIIVFRIQYLNLFLLVPIGLLIGISLILLGKIVWDKYALSFFVELLNNWE